MPRRDQISGLRATGLHGLQAGVLSRVHRAVVLGRTCSHRSARPADQALSSRSVRRVSANSTSGHRDAEVDIQAAQVQTAVT